MAHLSPLKSAGAAFLLGALATLGCESDVERRVALASLSSVCRINSDCSELLVCVFERCHQECATSRDCERGARCMRTEQGRNVCQLPADVACSDARPCPGEQVCGPDAECRDGCRSDDDCVTDQVCSAATCADPVELGPEGALTPAADPPAVPVPCAFHSDCPVPLVCEAGSCVPECVSDQDCGPGRHCDESACMPLATPGACLRHSDCPEGEACQGGQCAPLEPVPTPACDYDSDCGKAGQHCVGGACACECRSDADCGANRACQGACQCVPSRVLVGDVTISNDRDLAAIADVVEIIGQLSIDVHGRGVLRLPRLRKAERVLVGGTGTTVVLDALEAVSGDFICGQNCRADRLRSVGGLEVGTGTVGELTLPALRTAGNITLRNTSGVTALRLPSLTTAGDLNFTNNVALALVHAPLLGPMGSLTLTSNRSLKTFELPRAEPTVAIDLTYPEALETFSLPSATSLSGKLYVLDGYRLRSLDLRRLESVDELEIRGIGRATELNLSGLKRVAGRAEFAHLASALTLSLPALGTAGHLIFTGSLQATAFSAPQLTGVAGTLELSGLYELQTLDLSKLATVGLLRITATGLRNLDTLDKSRGGSLTSVATSALIDGNASLPKCTVESLRTALGADGSKLTQDRNCDCPGSFCQ